jgi:hypothetical protein
MQSSLMVIWAIENTGNLDQGELNSSNIILQSRPIGQAQQSADFANGREPNVACRVSHVLLLEFLAGARLNWSAVSTDVTWRAPENGLRKTVIVA